MGEKTEKDIAKEAWQLFHNMSLVCEHSSAIAELVRTYPDFFKSSEHVGSAIGAARFTLERLVYEWRDSGLGLSNKPPTFTNPNWHASTHIPRPEEVAALIDECIAAPEERWNIFNMDDERYPDRVYQFEQLMKCTKHEDWLKMAKFGFNKLMNDREFFLNCIVFEAKRLEQNDVNDHRVKIKTSVGIYVEQIFNELNLMIMSK